MMMTLRFVICYARITRLEPRLLTAIENEPLCVRLPRPWPVYTCPVLAWRLNWPPRSWRLPEQRN